MMKQLLEQNEERLLLPGDNPVPSRTSKGSIPLDSSSLVPTPCGQYGTTQTVGQELAAYYERIVDAEYEEHLEALKAEMREQYEYRKGELERWRARSIREMCAGLDV
jgi:hypothetical protein